MEKDAVPVEDMLELDRWAVAYAADFQKRVLVEYGSYRFHNVVTLLQTFASTDLGSFYLDVLKDRLYTTGARVLPQIRADRALSHHGDAPASYRSDPLLHGRRSLQALLAECR